MFECLLPTTTIAHTLSRRYGSYLAVIPSHCKQNKGTPIQVLPIDETLSSACRSVLRATSEYACGHGIESTVEGSAHRSDSR